MFSPCVAFCHISHSSICLFLFLLSVLRCIFQRCNQLLKDGGEFYWPQKTIIQTILYIVFVKKRIPCLLRFPALLREMSRWGQSAGDGWFTDILLFLSHPAFFCFLLWIQPRSSVSPLSIFLSLDNMSCHSVLLSHERAPAPTSQQPLIGQAFPGRWAAAW